MSTPKLPPCPYCNSTVEMYGTECYPEEGIEIECTKCEFNMYLSIPKRTNKLKEITLELYINLLSVLKDNNI